ncbi:MAG: response regulator transcription factor [Anaerolineales bacterium]|nr:response regulator transcription factor [Anaerolineales bacterium]
MARQAMSRGADALIAKQNGPSDWMAWQQWLIAQLHSVVDGWWRPTPEVAQLLALEEEKRRMTLADDPLPLTGRQLEVLNLMALNRTDAEVPLNSPSKKAPCGHIANIKRRFQLRYRWQVINEARKRGLGGAPEE